MSTNINSEPSVRLKTIGILLLILTTILWGSTFIITKDIILEMPIYFYLGVRFLFALLIFAPFFLKLKNINKKVIGFGILAGFVYLFSIIIQTLGLQTTTAGKGGFLTGLNAIIVPFLAWGIYKKRPNNRIWAAVGLSIIGMSLLLLEGESGIVIGDIFVLFCAIGFALYIILVDKHIQLVDIYLYLIVQLFIISMSCFLLSILFKESYNIFMVSTNLWFILIYMGCIASGVTFLTQNWGQKQVEPSHTAIIFTLEPVFAVIFASFLIGSETLTVQGWIGCSFIFLAIFITILKSEEISKDNKKTKIRKG